MRFWLVKGEFQTNVLRQCHGADHHDLLRNPCDVEGQPWRGNMADDDIYADIGGAHGFGGGDQEGDREEDIYDDIYGDAGGAQHDEQQGGGDDRDGWGDAGPAGTTGDTGAKAPDGAPGSRMLFESMPEGATPVLVGNLKWHTTDAEVEAACTTYGRVLLVQFAEDRATGRSKGRCVVVFEDKVSAEGAVLGLHGKRVGDSEIKLALAEAPRIGQMVAAGELPAADYGFGPMEDKRALPPGRVPPPMPGMGMMRPPGVLPGPGGRGGAGVAGSRGGAPPMGMGMVPGMVSGPLGGPMGAMPMGSAQMMGHMGMGPMGPGPVGPMGPMGMGMGPGMMGGHMGQMPVCFNCGMPGHRPNECPKRNPNFQGGFPGPRPPNHF